MLNPPQITAVIARERQRDLLAEAERERRCRSLRSRPAPLAILAASVRAVLDRSPNLSGGRTAPRAEAPLSAAPTFGA